MIREGSFDPDEDRQRNGPDGASSGSQSTEERDGSSAGASAVAVAVAADDDTEEGEAVQDNNEVRMPGREPETKEPQPQEGREMRQPNSQSNRGSGPVPIHGNETLAEFSMVLRLSASGTILKNKGGSEETAGAIAYAHRLVELSGDLLGLEGFAAMECVFREGRCLVFAEPNGDVVALRPYAEANLQTLRDSLGL